MEDTPMKLVSWNVNGFRAILNKGFDEIFKQIDADIFCIQETKMKPDQADFSPYGYYKYFNSAERPGYSGTAVYTRVKPLNVTFGLPSNHERGLDKEGRVITCEYDDFYLVCCYVPNSKAKLARIYERVMFDEVMTKHLIELNSKKPVIYCGDLNVANEDIDVHSPSTLQQSPGFSKEERTDFKALLNCGFTDSFRYKYPDLTGAYTWWDYRTRGRDYNRGWRIDYFVVSNRLVPSIKDAAILNKVYGSDHCPIGLEL